MKKLFMILAMVFAKEAFCGSIDTIFTKSNITDVTVFFSGAQIYRQAELKLSKGKHLIRVENLPYEINSQSIQVQSIKNCKILSVKHQLNANIDSKKSVEEITFNAKIKEQEIKIKEIKNKLSVYTLEENLLLENSQFTKKEGGSNISEIKEAADYYRLRLNEIKQSKLNLTLETEKILEQMQDLYAQYNKQTLNKRKSYSQLLIAIDCENDVATKLQFSYYIASAGWTPQYDFRVEDINKPFVIVYNASVYHTTGEEWKNVNIKLSTNNPSVSGEKPEIIPWYVGQKNPYFKEPPKITTPVSDSYTTQENNGTYSGTLKGKILDKETKEPIPFANVILESGGKQIGGTTTDFDGIYIIKPIPPGRYDLKTTYVGYKPMQVNSILITPDAITTQNLQLVSNITSLQTVEVIDYKIPLLDKNQTSAGESFNFASDGRYSAGITMSGGSGGTSRALNVGYNTNSEETKVKSKETTNFISNSLKSNVINLEYTIDIPYTIPSDGEDYNIKIKEVSLPVNYVYHAVPRLDKAAFLTAEIIDWNQLNLLNGKSSIYYQGTYAGETFIDVNQTSDTLVVSLGRDGNVLVKREGNKLMYDKKIIGNYTKVTQGWDITIKNNKDSKIKIFVEDQFPISDRKTIEVDRLEWSNAKVDDKTGKLTWDLEIEPNGKKAINFKYAVKYLSYLKLVVE